MIKKGASLLVLISALNIVPGFAAPTDNLIKAINKTTNIQDAKSEYLDAVKKLIQNREYSKVSETTKKQKQTEAQQHVDGIAQTRSPTRSVGSNLANRKSGEEKLNALIAETTEDVNKQEYEKNKKSELAKIEQSITKISVGSVYMIPIEWKDDTEIQSALAKWKKACNEKAKKPAHAEELSGEDDVEKISVKCVIKTCDDGYTRTDNNTKCTKETKVEKQTECTNDRGGTWKLSACYCGNIIMTQGAICQDGKIVSEKAQNKESCNANEETTWKGGKCVCKDSTKELTDEGCTEKVSNGNEKTSKDIDDKKDNKKNDKNKKPANEENEAILEEKEKAYEDAKEKEQSKENRLLTAATTAATGIGGMELAQGLAEQKADKAAEQDMSAYIATMRCTYGNGKQVKAGNEEIELPGGNDATLMKYRTEYIALANDLKERKVALDMKPGIESEEILDKADLGLYDDENIGITDGAYASLYRSQMLNSEKDQEQIDEAKKTSKTRVIAGGVAAGVGVVGGLVGDSLINGKLGELIKEKKANKNIDTSETISTLDKNTIVETLTDDEIKQLIEERGLKQEGNR